MQPCQQLENETGAEHLLHYSKFTEINKGINKLIQMSS